MTSMNGGDDVAPDQTATTLSYNHMQEDGLFDKDEPSRSNSRGVEPETNSMTVQNSSTLLSDEGQSLPPLMFRIPNTAFGIPLGLAGHAIMWKAMRNSKFIREQIEIGVMDMLNIIFWFLALVLAIVITVLYTYKIFTSFPLVLAEYLNEVRCHFFNAPNLIFIMLMIGMPDYINVSKQTIRILWAPGFIYQVGMTSQIYKDWMFSKRRNFSEAKPQFLMSTVGWFLLATLGQACDIRDEWGIGLPQMCFGAGFILYIDIVIFIFGKLHENMGMKGSPAMFLLIAPPSVGVVSLDLFNDGASDFSQFGEMLLGWVFVLLLLLIRLGPAIWRVPSVLGEYWAYVFPLAAATTATIRYASALGTISTEILAIIMIAISMLSLFLVLGRMTFHMYQCFKGRAQWGDPLFRMEKYHTRQIW